MAALIRAAKNRSKHARGPIRAQGRKRHCRRVGAAAASAGEARAPGKSTTCCLLPAATGAASAYERGQNGASSWDNLSYAANCTAAPARPRQQQARQHQAARALATLCAALATGSLAARLQQAASRGAPDRSHPN